MSDYKRESSSLYDIKANYGGVVIKRNGTTIFTFCVSQIVACCGTMNIANGASYITNFSEQDKAFIFNEICNIAIASCTRNIIYADISKDNGGQLNKVLEGKFKCIHKYRNTNTDNIVEIRSFELDPHDLEVYVEANEYDDENWEPNEEDDNY